MGTVDWIGRDLSFRIYPGAMPKNVRFEVWLQGQHLNQHPTCLYVGARMTSFYLLGSNPESLRVKLSTLSIRPLGPSDDSIRIMGCTIFFFLLLLHVKLPLIIITFYQTLFYLNIFPFVTGGWYQHTISSDWMKLCLLFNFKHSINVDIYFMLE